MPHFTLLSGEKISTPALSPALNAFLDRLRAGVEDVTVSEATFIELLYSVENPLLDQTIMPGRGTVTKAVFADPAYHVMLDLLGRKRLALGSLDMDKVRARYSMTVAQAAAHRGVHESAIRQAIQNRRLSSVRIDGRHMLDPEQVNALETSRRGPPAPLELVYGSIDATWWRLVRTAPRKRAESNAGRAQPSFRVARCPGTWMVLASKPRSTKRDSGSSSRARRSTRSRLDRSPWPAAFGSSTRPTTRATRANDSNPSRPTIRRSLEPGSRS